MGSHEPCNEQDFSVCDSRLELAYDATYALFKHIPGGTHALKLAAIKRLLIRMGMKRFDSFWDIGCGVPVLAACASSFTGTPSLGPDLSTFAEISNLSFYYYVSLLFLLFIV